MVEEHNGRGGRQLAGFAPAALDRLASLPWTGNVEELAGIVREACQSVSTVWIGEADLPPRVRAVAAAGLHPRREPEPIQLDAFLLEIEQELIERSLKIAKGNKSRAARLLGISRARLLRRLEQLGMLVRETPAIDFRPVPEDDGDQDDDQATEEPSAAGGD
jgi:DNA-binding NtrC family response regulator